jgi:hypothetical protein
MVAGHIGIPKAIADQAVAAPPPSQATLAD